MESVNLQLENEKLKKENEHLRRQVRSAVNLRFHLMPNVFPVFPDLHSVDVYADTIGMAKVGGDFFDIFRIDADHIGILIADIFDGGDAAALFMVAFKLYLAGELSMGFSPDKLLQITNNRLSRYNEDNLCLSAWYGVYEVSTGKISAVNAGHETPLALREKGASFCEEDQRSFLMGVLEGVEYTAYDFTLEPGEALLLYTDGTLKAQNKAGERYSAERMGFMLESSRMEDAEGTVAKIQEDLVSFSENEPFIDDITLLCLKRREE